MAVMLLCLSGPMQSWGDSSRFARRTTRREPTKSGIVGLLAAALGRSRQDPIEDLAQLELGVRVDQPGQLMRDFQTERSLDEKKVMPLSNRYYLADSKFLVALSGPDDMLHQLDKAVRAPRWPLFLGRRSCIPDQPLARGMHAEYSDVREALEHEPWIAAEHYRRKHAKDAQQLEVVYDARDGEICESQADYPLSFSAEGRRYACRPVVRTRVANPSLTEETDSQSEKAPSHAGAPVDHDPLSCL